MKVVWALWSVVGWTFVFFWMLVCFLVAFPTALFVPFQRWYPWMHLLMRQAYIWSTWHAPTVQYDPDFDPDRRSVYCQNHVSVLDVHIACEAIPHAFCGMENAAHFWIPIYGWLMTMTYGIRVPREREGRFDKMLAEAKERVKRGLSILMFPEGHRTVDGTVRPFRRGPFFLAREIGYPVVPVAARGLFDVLPKGTGIFRPGRVEIYVGPQLETAGLSDDEIEALAEEAQRRVTAFVERRDDAGTEDV